MKGNGLALLVLAQVWASGSCTNNPYVIGEVCPGVAAGADASVDPRCGATNPNTTLAINFGTSGVSQLGSLALPSGNVTPTWRLFGQGSSATGWTADVGGALASTGVAVANDAAPFSVDTRAAVLAVTPTYVAGDTTTGAVGGDDFALEIVLRAAAGATLFDKRAGATGWALRETTAGALTLELDDGAAPVVTVSSEALTTNAWYHCLFWVSHAAGARVDCDGRMGAPVALPALGALDSATKIAAGGGASIELAEVALFRVAAGGLGDPSTWLGVGGRRFAQLTGTSPQIARGSATPAPGIRGSEAYLDLQSVGGPRALFLVGADWPRVACRVDRNGTRVCGYLSEPERTRLAPADPRAWVASALTLAERGPAFPDPLVRFETLVPSATNAAHALSFTGTLGAARQIFSFFVNATAAGGAGARLEASAGVAGTAVFDVVAGTVVAAPTAVGASAAIEAWGGGTFRCSYVFDADVGPSTYTLRLVDAAGDETFAGAGAGTIAVAGLQVDVGLAYAGSLLGVSTTQQVQPPDRLTFVADGNLPTGASTSVSVTVLLPAGARLTDQAMVNINNGGTFEDQVQLFARGDSGLAGFWGLSTMGTHWTFDAPASSPVTDGARHVVVGTWNASLARLAIDGASTTQAQMLAGAPAIPLDQIDVGFSEASSGALEGLVGSLEIGAM
ncbi:MAG TPA: hypothetical protein VLA14_15660 [Polyangia bacterium]|jgi:hypothetical protein|nr:hypothetical protein [Polyangia bacterium]